MLLYLLKRILLFLPTLLVVSLLAFGLSQLTPGDPVEQYLGEDVFAKTKTPADLLRAEQAYAQVAASLRTDKPAFYCSLTTQAHPDTLHRVTIGFRRNTLEKLIGQYGNWTQIQAWYASIRELDLALRGLPDSMKAASGSFGTPLRELYTSYSHGAATARLNEAATALRQNRELNTVLGPSFADLQKSYEAMRSQATPQLLQRPILRWHGLDNQYHEWLSAFVRGDFGTSLHAHMPVTQKLGSALFWTLAVSLPAICLAFGLAVPLGAWSAVRQGSRFDRAVTVGLFMLFSLPAFWAATLLLVFFTNREYGMDFFPGPGLGEIPTSASWWRQLWLAAPHLMLPIACVAYPSLALISRQARGGMLVALRQDYVRTARAKGLPERTVIWRHAFRNALFPLITLLGSVVPSAIAGSVAIEVIFSIPGMGWLTWNAIFQKDWPIVFAVLMLGSVLTVVGMLLSDVLYRWADPRVKLEA